MKRLLLSLTILIFSIQSGYSYYFKFQDQKGDLYRISASSIQEAYIDNRKIAVYDQGYKALLRVEEVGGDFSKINGEYYYMAKPYGSKGSYEVLDNRVYKSSFKRFNNGKMDISSDFFYPVIRNLPVFLDKDIQIGESWQGEGSESQDFTRIGIPKPFIVPFDVSYKYERDETKNGKDYAVISVFYYINFRFGKKIDVIPSAQNNYGRASYPIRAVGFFKGDLLWDKEANQIGFYGGKYNFIYIMSNGEVREWKGEDQGEITIVRENQEEEKKMEEEAVKEIGTLGEVQKADQGIKLIFSDILFDFNKVNLKSEIIPTLDKIIEILKKYPKYEVRVEGHSDDRGAEEYKQASALGRSKVVANYLVSKGIDPNRVSYSGFSDKKPLVPNTSEENRSKNRRVEIYIITK